MRPIKVRAKLLGTEKWVYGGGVWTYTKRYGDPIEPYTLLLGEDDRGMPIIHRVDPDTVEVVENEFEKGGKE